jgi:quercetin dioxygenase-like cupin family protein
MERRKPKVIDLEKKAKVYFPGGAYHRTVVSKEGEGIDISVNLARIEPGQTHEFHSHEQDEVVYILRGSGKYLLEDGEINYNAGDFCFMPRGALHKNVVMSEDGVDILSIFNPAEY